MDSFGVLKPIVELNLKHLLIERLKNNLYFYYFCRPLPLDFNASSIEETCLD